MCARTLVSRVTTLFTAALVGLLLWADDGRAQTGPTTHTLFLTALEVKGSTSSDELAPPPVNPADLSKGYGYEAPGKADTKAPNKWQVASYLFSPAYVVVRQGDTVDLTVFVVNGNKHEVKINGPDGREVMAETTWNRGRQYQTRFVTEHAGSYQLICSTHAPSMITTFFVLPR